MSLTIETPIHFKRAKAGKKTVALGPAPEQTPPPPDPVPRISRLMALALHFDELIREGVVRDYVDLAGIITEDHPAKNLAKVIRIQQAWSPLVKMLGIRP